MASVRLVAPSWPLVAVAVLLAPGLPVRGEDVAAPGAVAAPTATPTPTAAPAPAPASTPTPTPTPTSTSTATPAPAPTPTDDLPELEAVVRGARPRKSAAALAPGAAVTVVDATRFAGEAKGAGELLATSPGVAVTDTGGIGRLATVSIRGASADQVKVLLDGVPLNPAAGGGVDLSSIPPQWISRIEVVRGTEGIHHGTGALGGVVNVITAPPRGASWSAGATAGSFGTYQADAQAGAGGPGWGLLGSVAASHSDGDFTYLSAADGLGRRTAETRTRNGSSLGGALLKGFALVGGGRLDAAAQLSGGSRELPGWPGNLTPHDWQEDARGIASVRFRREGPGGVFYTAEASTRLDRLALRLEQVARDVIRQDEVAGTGTLGAGWCGRHAALSASVEAGADRLAGGGTGDHSRPTFAAVLAGEVSALDGRARLGPAVRFERQGKDEGISAKLGGAVPLAGPLSLRASGGRTYRVPSFSELYLQQGLLLPNPALRPEVGVGGDAALVLDGVLGTASAGAFATLYRDLIAYQAASYRRLRPENVDRSVVRGVEAELATAPWRRGAGLNAQAAYTYTESELLRGAEEELGKDLPRRPHHRLYARIGAGGALADAHVETQWISRQWLGNGHSAPIPSAFTLGAGASVRLWRAAGLRLHVEVRNLLDDRTLTDSYDNPLPGRTILVTLRAGSHPEKP